jgi:hypothetical protein
LRVTVVAVATRDRRQLIDVLFQVRAVDRRVLLVLRRKAPADFTLASSARLSRACPASGGLRARGGRRLLLIAVRCAATVTAAADRTTRTAIDDAL